MHTTVLDLMVLNVFNINSRHGKISILKEIVWQFPEPKWINVNTNGAARGCLGLVACGGNFRGNKGKNIGSFSMFLDIHSFFFAKFVWVIYMLEHAWTMGFTRLWLKCN